MNPAHNPTQLTNRPSTAEPLTPPYPPTDLQRRALRAAAPARLGAELAARARRQLAGLQRRGGRRAGGRVGRGSHCSWCNLGYRRRGAQPAGAGRRPPSSSRRPPPAACQTAPSRCPCVLAPCRRSGPLFWTPTIRGRTTTSTLAWRAGLPLPRCWAINRCSPHAPLLQTGHSPPPTNIKMVVFQLSMQQVHGGGPVSLHVSRGAGQARNLLVWCLHSVGPAWLHVSLNRSLG